MACESNSYSKILASLDEQNALYDPNDVFGGTISIGGPQEQRIRFAVENALQNIQEHAAGHNIDQALENLPKEDAQEFRDILAVYADDPENAIDRLVEFSNQPAPEVNYYHIIKQNADNHKIWENPSDDIWASPTREDYMNAFNAIPSENYEQLFEDVPKDVQQGFLSSLSAGDLASFEAFTQQCSSTSSPPEPSIIPLQEMDLAPTATPLPSFSLD
ncbi:MAG: hypothetical protein ACRBCT_01330 [Alphaproteobacteria bacterium]